MDTPQLSLTDRITIADASYGREFGWHVLSDRDEPLATLTAPRYADMFWTSYIVTPLAATRLLKPRISGFLTATEYATSAIPMLSSKFSVISIRKQAAQQSVLTTSTLISPGPIVSGRHYGSCDAGSNGTRISNSSVAQHDLYARQRLRHWSIVWIASPSVSVTHFDLPRRGHRLFGNVVSFW